MRVAGTLVILLATTGAVQAGHDIAISPSPITFSFDGLTEGGSPGDLQFGFFQVANTGTKRLLVTDMAITGPDAESLAFDVSNPLCGGGHHCKQHFSLAPGEVRGFSVTCTPTQVGALSASLVVKSNAAPRTTVPMPCYGNSPPVLVISPSSLDFGIVHLCEFPDNRCGVTRTLTITNETPTPPLFQFYISGISSRPQDDFTVTPGLGTAINPIILALGQSVSLEITFHPRHTGGPGGPLAIVSLSPGQDPVRIPMQASGGLGFLTFDIPDSLGSVVFGQTLISSIAAHNSGTAGLSISEVTVLGDCVVTGGDQHFTLQPGEAFTRPVACTPTFDRFGSAELQVGFSNEEVDFAFRDFGVLPIGGALALDVFTPPLDFAVTVGTSATVPVNVTNRGFDTAQLVSLTSTNPLFTATLLDGSLPLTLGPDESAEVEVTFTPTAAVSVSGALTFEVSLGLSATLQVTGEGLPADMARARAAAIPDASAPAPQVGGCSTTGGASLPLVLGALWLLARRRRGSYLGSSGRRTPAAAGGC